jgi:hypothetical protein
MKLLRELLNYKQKIDKSSFSLVFLNVLTQIIVLSGSEKATNMFTVPQTKKFV